MARLSIGEFLAKLRKEKGFTQQEVANTLDVSNRTVSAWEKDKALPDVLLLPAIAELYGVSVDEILYGARKQSDADAPAFSPKTEKSILLRKLSRITLQSYILLGVSILAQIFMFWGWYNDTFTYTAVGKFNWWLFAQYVSLVAVIAVFAVLIALWKSCESSVDVSSEESKSFCLSLSQRVVIHFYVAAIISFVLGFFVLIVCHLVFPLRLMCTTYLVASVVWLISGTLLYRHKVNTLSDGVSQIKQSRIILLYYAIASLLFSLCVLTTLVISENLLFDNYDYYKILKPNYYMFLCAGLSFVLLLLGTLLLYCKLTAHSQEDKTILVKTSHSMSVCSYVVASLYVVLEILTIYYYFMFWRLSFAVLVILPIFSLASLLLGALLHRRNLIRWGGEKMRAILKRNCKRYLKVSLWGLIPIPVGVLMICLTFCINFRTRAGVFAFLFSGIAVLLIDIAVCFAICLAKREKTVIKQ